MAARELVVLGTASQVPTRQRNHNGYLLRWDGHSILFDPGEGTQRQLLLAGVSAATVDRICLTHLHGDHSLGLPGVLARRVVDQAQLPAVLHYPDGAQQDVAALRRAGAPAGAAETVDQPVTEDGVLVDTGDWQLEAARLDHRIPCVGYRLSEPEGRRIVPELCTAAGIRGPDVGRLQREGRLSTPNGDVRLEDVSVPRPGQAVAVVMDTRPCAGADHLARGVDLLVCEATYLSTDAELAHAYGHLTARQAGELAARAGVRHLLLTHFSRRYGDDGEPFAAEARSVFGPDQGTVTAANDFDVVALPPRRTPGDPT